MEKIKKALDRARQERQTGTTGHKPDAQDNISEIKYTKTQSVESSNILRRENRILSARA